MPIYLKHLVMNLWRDIYIVLTYSHARCLMSIKDVSAGSYTLKCRRSILDSNVKNAAGGGLTMVNVKVHDSCVGFRGVICQTCEAPFTLPLGRSPATNHMRQSS